MPSSDDSDKKKETKPKPITEQPKSILLNTTTSTTTSESQPGPSSRRLNVALSSIVQGPTQNDVTIQPKPENSSKEEDNQTPKPSLPQVRRQSVVVTSTASKTSGLARSRHSQQQQNVPKKTSAPSKIPNKSKQDKPHSKPSKQEAPNRSMMESMAFPFPRLFNFGTANDDRKPPTRVIPPYHRPSLRESKLFSTSDLKPSQASLKKKTVSIKVDESTSLSVPLTLKSVSKALAKHNDPELVDSISQRLSVRPSFKASSRFLPEELDILGAVDTVIIKGLHVFPQEVELALELHTSCEPGRVCEIATMRGTTLFFAAEVTSCVSATCSGAVCGCRYPLKLCIFEPSGKNVLTVEPTFCGEICCCTRLAYDCLCDICTPRKFTIKLADGKIAGNITGEMDTCFFPVFTLSNSEGRDLMVAEAPCPCCELCLMMCGCRQNLQQLDIMDGDKSYGRVKKWRHKSPKEGNYLFQIEYTDDADLEMRMLVLGVSFVIDFLSWRSEGRNILDYILFCCD